MSPRPLPVMYGLFPPIISFDLPDIIMKLAFMGWRLPVFRFLHALDSCLYTGSPEADVSLDYVRKITPDW